MPPLPADALPCTFEEFVRRFPTLEGRCELLGLAGSAAAALIARLRARDAGSPLCIVTPDSRGAGRFRDDLAFYTGTEVLLFPHWGINPYEPLNPPLELEATRLAALAALMRPGAAPLVVIPARALMQRLIPRKELEEGAFTLAPGRECSREMLQKNLASLGYAASPLVEERGAFSLRGDLLDIFPPAVAQPVRVEFFGDEVERIRRFDPATQRTQPSPLPSLEILPVREMTIAGKNFETLSRRLKLRCDELALPRPVREAILADLREGLFFPGCSGLLPFAYEKLDTFFDYARNARWFFVDPEGVDAELERFAAAVENGYSRIAAKGELHAEPCDFYLPQGELEQMLEGLPRIDIPALETVSVRKSHPVLRFSCESNADMRLDASQERRSVAALAEKLKQHLRDGWKVLLVCHQQGQANHMRNLLEGHELGAAFSPEKPRRLVPGELALTLGTLSAGLRLPEERLLVIAEEEIFGPRSHQHSSRKRRPRDLLTSFAELHIGDFVVHSEHGIARFHGLLHIKTAQAEGDFLHLEYAEGARLYLPVERIEKVSRYVGPEGAAPSLDKLGGNAWEKAVVRAKAAVEELARELLRLQAQREMRPGFAFSAPDQLFTEFEASFPYDETEDQLSAIHDVIADMTSTRPMDRLVCGDVGYGKTEVAIRAAFKAVMDGKQVAVLVPTTVLAQQHWETFRARFAPYPVRVEMVSRFRPAAAQKKALEETAAGKVDILIGTHRLLQRDVHFRDLGLLIIDEEQRFGVTHKEKLKRIRAEVDTLTLTATPIPRTLHLSLAGLRDLSIITTPPVDRQAIRTYVAKFDEALIRDAVLRELQRGGQVFFVHNRVRTIDALAGQLRALLPEAKIAVGHGQMAAAELEKVMLDFVEGRTNVLLCTAIIENGLDIPRANTIIVDRADLFGLSQLYQLRGRVGRSHQRAYAYLLVPGTLTPEARERLKVLQNLTELGAGFSIASHDLEIRGAGELLGARQSGHVSAVGFELYGELLEEAVQELRGLERESRIDPEIRLGLSAFLPEDYVPDPNQRLTMYKRLAAAETEDELYGLTDELADRYGALPPPGELLLEIMRLRVMMKRLRITLAEHDGRDLALAFQEDTPVRPEKLLELLQSQKKRYSITPDYRLMVHVGRLTPEERLTVTRNELLQLLEMC